MFRITKQYLCRCLDKGIKLPIKCKYFSLFPAQITIIDLFLLAPEFVSNETALLHCHLFLQMYQITYYHAIACVFSIRPKHAVIVFVTLIFVVYEQCKVNGKLLET